MSGDPLDELSSRQQRCLEDLVRVVSSVRRWFERAVGEPGDPGPDASWSVAEHALHIVLAMESVASGFGDPGRLVREREPSLERVALLETWRIPKGVPAPDRVTPRLILSAEEILERVDAARDALLGLVRDVAEGDPKEYLAHFALGPMTRTEWFRFMLIHARHHEDLLVARGQIRR